MALMGLEEKELPGGGEVFFLRPNLFSIKKNKKILVFLSYQMNNEYEYAFIFNEFTILFRSLILIVLREPYLKFFLNWVICVFCSLLKIESQFLGLLGQYLNFPSLRPFGLTFLRSIQS